MDICVETGEGVEGANSYVGSQYALDFANSRGLELPCEIQSVKQLAFRAMDYVESFSSRFSGERVLSTQTTSYPRTGSCVGCIEVADNFIPDELKKAQIYTMVAIHAGFDPMANISGDPFVIDKTIGPLRIKTDPDSKYARAKLPMVHSLLSEMFSSRGDVRFVKG